MKTNINSFISYKILAIEDNLGDVDLIKEFLNINSDFNFELIHEEKLSTALEVLVKGNIDIILLDLSLPDSQGLDTFHKIYSHYSNIPIIVLSGLNDKNIALKCVKDGAQDYLVKGDFHKKFLVQSIVYSIERKKLENTIKEFNNTLELKVKERTNELDEANITLRNVLKNIDQENNKNMENIALNIENNILPLIEKMRKLEQFDPKILNMLKDNIDEINSKFHRALINFKCGLTPTEIKICKLVRSGYLAKEIADILNIAPATVNEHKSNIRKKLGIKDSSINLKIFLDELVTT